MEANQSSEFKFVGYKILNSVVSVNENNAESEEYNIKITPSGKIEGKYFDLTLIVEVKQKDEYYKANIEALGRFEFEQNIEDPSDYFIVNAPAILFPYVRAYISSLTALSGIDTIIPPTLNLTSLKDSLKENINRKD